MVHSIFRKRLIQQHDEEEEEEEEEEEDYNEKASEGGEGGRDQKRKIDGAASLPAVDLSYCYINHCLRISLRFHIYVYVCICYMYMTYCIQLTYMHAYIHNTYSSDCLDYDTHTKYMLHVHDILLVSIIMKCN